MERLTIREKNGFVMLGKRPKGCMCPTSFCNYENCDKRKDRSCSVLMALDRLAAYEDAEEQGRRIVLNRQLTNADKYFRNATDEELADWLTLLLWGENRDVPFAICCTVEKWLDWLKQEAESDG